MTGWRVAVRGIRHRPGRSLMVLLVAALATATAVVAPAYARAAQQAVLTDQLRSAPPSATNVEVRTDPSATKKSTMDTAEVKLHVGALIAAAPGVRAHLDAPIAGADVSAVATVGRPGTDVLARLAYRDRACAHLLISSGTCAAEPGTVTISERSAKQYGVGVGQTVRLRDQSATTASTSTSTTTTNGATSFVVAGLYRPKQADEVYWGRGGYFAHGAPDSESSLSRIDAVFVAEEGDLAVPGAAIAVHLDYPVRVDGVPLDDLSALRSGLAKLETEVNRAELVMATALGAVLDEVANESAALSATVPAIAVPLVVICWFVLFLLVAALIDERGPELALARLRGFSQRRAAAFARAEANALIVVAAPLGAAAGFGLVEIAARTMLGTTIHVEVRWPALAMAVAATAVGLVAVRLASARTLGRGVLDLLRRVSRRPRWSAGVIDVVVVAAAAASLAAAFVDGHAALALLAPAALAVMAGVLAGRLLTVWSTNRLRRHQRRGQVSALLAHAQLARRSSGARVVLIVTVAVALLTFASTVWDVAAQARSAAAADELGARRVLQVSAAHPEALVAAVDAADPGGHSMAVVRASQRYGDHTVELLGVSSTALADIALWRGRGAGDVADLAARLRPETVAALGVRTFVRVDATVRVEAGPAADLARIKVGALVAAPGEPTRTVGLGALEPGRQTYQASIDGCATSCRLLGFVIDRSQSGRPSSLDLTIDLAAVTTGTGEVTAAFDKPARWRANTTRAAGAGVELRSGEALSVRIRASRAGEVVLEYVDTPDALPVALAGPTPADDTGADDFTFPGLGDAVQGFFVVDRSDWLPRAGRNGLLFDLDYAVRSAQRGSSLSDNTRLRYEVWAGPQAPPDLASRLAGAGVSILSDTTVDERADRLARGAPALGLRLYLLAGVAGLALAVMAVAFIVVIGAESRREELAALRLAGVPAGVLRRGLVREYAHVLGLPLVAGLTIGLVSAALMVPAIDLVTVSTSVSEVSAAVGVSVTELVTRLSRAGGALPYTIAATVLGLSVAALSTVVLVRPASGVRSRRGRRHDG